MDNLGVKLNDIQVYFVISTLNFLNFGDFYGLYFYFVEF